MARVHACPSALEVEQFFLGPFEAAAPEIEASDRIPERLLRDAAQLGVHGLSLPPDHGGFGLTLSQLEPYLEAAAQGPGCGRMLVHLSNGIWRPVLRYGNAAQQALVQEMASGQITVAFALTEPEGGSGRDLHSLATRIGDHWELSGRKHLVTFGDRAEWFLLTAASDERRAADSLTSYLLPRETPGLAIEPDQHTMGLKGTGHARLAYDRVRVRDACRLGEVGQGLEVALSFLDYSRISLSICMVGLARRALDEAIAYARRRVTFGRPIAERESIRSLLAEMHADVAAAHALVVEAATAFDRGDPITTVAATCKLFCLEMVGRVTDRALRIHGGFGYTTDAAIERIYRDARGFWFEEGTAEIQRLVIARGVLGEHA